MHNTILADLTADFAACPQVEAILLGGSRAHGGGDESSDYDLYVYVNGEIPVDHRRGVLSPHVSSIEMDNRFWETEDDGLLRDGTPIDVLYRSLSWIEGELSRVVEDYSASTGYTTCIWSNFCGSEILFDRHGDARALQERFDVPYPRALTEAIVAKNLPLLGGTMPAYPGQIAKALKRGDLVSVNHRLAAYFESYFDILFAMNGLRHPGEKRMLEKLEKAEIRPEGFPRDVKDLLRAGLEDSQLVTKLEVLTDRLRAALRSREPA